MSVGGRCGPHEHGTTRAEPDLRAGRRRRLARGAHGQLPLAVLLVDLHVEHGVVAVVAATYDLPGQTLLAVGRGQVDLLRTDQDPHWGAVRQRLAAPLGRELAEWRVDERAVEDAGDHIGLPDEACQLVIDRPRV